MKTEKENTGKNEVSSGLVSSVRTDENNTTTNTQNNTNDDNSDEWYNESSI